MKRLFLSREDCLEVSERHWFYLWLETLPSGAPELLWYVNVQVERRSHQQL